MELAQSLHRIGNDIVAAYLVETAEGVTVIDAGLPGHWKELLAELDGMGRTLADVKGLILTHGDSDHVGFAERLRREGVPVYVHAADADRARGGSKPENPRPAMGWAALGFMAYALRKGGAKTTWLSEVIPVVDGQTLDLPGAPRIIGLPGHSAGSIAVHIPAVDAVFATTTAKYGSTTAATTTRINHQPCTKKKSTTQTRRTLMATVYLMTRLRCSSSGDGGSDVTDCCGFFIGVPPAYVSLPAH